MLWSVPQRNVELRANQLYAGDASSLASAYSALPSQTQMGDRAIEFPFNAINDALLNSAGKMVHVIGNNVESEYRRFFYDTTDSISDGGRVTGFSQAGHPIIGVLGAVRDATDNTELELVPRQFLRSADNIALKITPYYYNSDGQRIWHTRTSVVADVVVWEAEVERYWMESSPRGECPFPDAIIGILEDGALAEIFRSKFNVDQAQIFEKRFEEGLKTL